MDDTYVFPEDQVLPLIKILLIAQGEVCFYCEGKISFDSSRGWLKATRDHFYPVSRGGSKGISNIVLACKGCNNRKRARMPRVIELVKWNRLAAVWPHITPIDLEPLAPKKACRRCGQQIPLDRLLKTRMSLLETHTCSPECSRKEHNRRTKILHRQVKAGRQTPDPFWPRQRPEKAGFNPPGGTPPDIAS
jgi:hypothetical protein